MKIPFVSVAHRPSAVPQDVDENMDENMDENVDEKPVRTRRSRRLFWIIVGSIILVALAIGLGVGLGLGLNRGGDDGNESGGSGAPSAPLPTGTVTNRTFWQPAVNSSWQIVLLNPITIADDATSTTPDVQVFDIDLFTNNQSTLTKLHGLDKKVICYFSAGSYEPNRPDSDQFLASDKGKGLDGWPGEVWLQTNSENVRKIMSARIKLASDKGCDAIDPDNVDGYQNDNGLGLTSNDTVSYMRFLSDEANRYNMSTGLKNAGDVVEDVVSFTHFSVNEQCAQYGECDTFSPFVDAGKPVFHIEYPRGAPDVSTSAVSGSCTDSGKGAGSENFSTVIKKMNLDGWVEYCDASVDTTATLATSS